MGLVSVTRMVTHPITTKSDSLLTTRTPMRRCLIGITVLSLKVVILLPWTQYFILIRSNSVINQPRVKLDYVILPAPQSLELTILITPVTAVLVMLPLFTVYYTILEILANFTL